MDSRFGIACTGAYTDMAALGCTWQYRYDQVLYGMNYSTPPGQCGLVRPDQTRLDLLQLSVGYNEPGRIWFLGNEPNNGRPAGDGMTPSDFADWFHTAAVVIKAMDPTAKIGGPATLNWTGGGAAWAGQFVGNYRARYGPLESQQGGPLDIWTLHMYGMDGTPSENATHDALECQACAVELTSWTLGALPLWVTEFGAVRMGGNFGAMVAYLDAIVPWLRVGGASYGVQAWFLFAARATDGASYAIEANGTLNDCGRQYQEYALGLR